MIVLCSNCGVELGVEADTELNAFLCDACKEYAEPPQNPITLEELQQQLMELMQQMQEMQEG